MQRHAQYVHLLGFTGVGTLNTFSLPQIKAWTANPQQFVEDEDDDTFSYSVRISAQDLLLVRWRLFFFFNKYSGCLTWFYSKLIRGAAGAQN